MRWHINDAAPIGDGLITGSGGPIDLRSVAATDVPQFGAWNHPAMMEVSIITFPTTNIRSTDINDTTMFFSPNNGGLGTTSYAADKQILPARCDPATAAGENFVCEMTINFNGLPNSQNVALRMTNRYAPTTIELTMSSGVDASGAVRLFDDTQASVDVTGEAGGVLRRVEAALDLTTPNLLPDFVVQSSTDICKNFSYTDDPAEFGGTPGTSCR